MALARTRDGDPLTKLGLAGKLGLSDSTLRRWEQKGGIPDRHADAVAVAAGFLPWEVWPDWVAYSLTLPDYPACLHGHPKPADARHCRICDRNRKHQRRAAA